MNFKGGVGKTTLSVNLAAALSARDGRPGKNRVLLVDVDPQAHATLYTLGEPAPVSQSLVGIIERHRQGKQEFIASTDLIGYTAPSPVFSGHFPALHLLASHHELRSLELEIEQKLARKEWPSGPPRSYKLFSYLLGKVWHNYDFIIFDCAPNFHWLTASAIFASDDFIVPVIADFLSIDGLRELIHLLAEDHAAKASGRTRRIRLIPVMLWADARDTVHAQYVDKLKREIVPELCKDGAMISEMLKACEVVDGLQRLKVVQKQVQQRRPLTDLDGSEAARIQLENLVTRIMKWKD